MSDQRKGGIAWTNETWNPVRGCSRVSEGCRNCYAETTAARFCGPGQPYEGLAERKNGKARWTGVARFIPEKLDAPLRWKRPRMVFVNSMSDLFHESLTNEQIAAVFGVMAASPAHTFQVLTKRPKRMLEWFEWVDEPQRDHGPPPETVCGIEATNRGADVDSMGLPEWPLSNVWLGVSVEDQASADERIPLLLRCPAAVRWVSAEPLLGPIDFQRIQWPGRHAVDVLSGGAWEFGGFPGFTQHSDMETLDWIVVGGESGPGARPCAVEWVRSIVRQCSEGRQTPVFVKQLGAAPTQDFRGDGPGGWDHDALAKWPFPKVWQHIPGEPGMRISLRGLKGGNVNDWPEDLRVRQWPEVTQ